MVELLMSQDRPTGSEDCRYGSLPFPHGSLQSGAVA